MQALKQLRGEHGLDAVPIFQMRSKEVTQLVSAGQGGGAECESVTYYSLMLLYCLSALSLPTPHHRWGLGSLTRN